MEPIYLDHAATTPLDAQVRAEMEPFLGPDFGNPSARHPLGQRAAEALDRARRRVARALGVGSNAVVFTSGGTEANNLALLGFARARREHGRHVLVGPTEHPSVRAAARALAEEGFEVETARLAPGGALDLEDLAGRLRGDTVAVGQMLANNEFGAVYPVRELARRVRARAPRAAICVDAVQAFGKLECSPIELGVDAVSVSAHKVHGPKGAGALAFGGAGRPRPLVFGGGQEGGLRSGTENVAALVGLGRAAQLAEQRRERAVAHLVGLRERLAGRLGALPGARLLEPGGEPPLPSILAVVLPGAPADVRMHHLETRGVYVSAGSACRARSKEISPALTALGLGEEEARCVLRFSFAQTTTAGEVDRAADAVEQVGRELEALAR